MEGRGHSSEMISCTLGLQHVDGEGLSSAASLELWSLALAGIWPAVGRLQRGLAGGGLRESAAGPLCSSHRPSRSYGHVEVSQVHDRCAAASRLHTACCDPPFQSRVSAAVPLSAVVVTRQKLVRACLYPRVVGHTAMLNVLPHVRCTFVSATTIQSIAVMLHNHFNSAGHRLRSMGAVMIVQGTRG